MSSPVHTLGQGVALILLFFHPPQGEGVGAPQGAWPGFRQTGPELRKALGGPGTPGPGREASRPAPCGAPTRHLSFWPLTVVGPGRLVVAGEAARVRPGDEGCVSPLPAGAAPVPRSQDAS